MTTIKALCEYARACAAVLGIGDWDAYGRRVENRFIGIRVPTYTRRGAVA